MKTWRLLVAGVLLAASSSSYAWWDWNPWPVWTPMYWADEVIGGGWDDGPYGPWGPDYYGPYGAWGYPGYGAWGYPYAAPSAGWAPLPYAPY